MRGESPCQMVACSPNCLCTQLIKFKLPEDAWLSDSWADAGLHEGLKTLSDGGTPPKLLIIDDGWQCTDVDVPLRKPLTSRMMMLKEMQVCIKSLHCPLHLSTV